jgi:hypothetical protein
MTHATAAGRKAYAAAYEISHREEIGARKAAWRASHREEIKAYNITYRAAHLAEGRVRTAAYRAAHPERIRECRAALYAANRDKMKDQKLARLYGLTRTEFLALGDTCNACGARANGKALAVDHDHGTGRVRGLLCLSCNIAMGMVKDDRARLLALVGYLDKHEMTPS